jgi:putative hydrolase of the HAD superfamily
MYKGLDDICKKLRIAPYLDVILTSGEAGADKPDPVIFLEAVRRAGADSSQSIYLGDQYEIDIIGARKAGLATVLVDRYNRYPNFIECPVIRELNQLDTLI